MSLKKRAEEEKKVAHEQKRRQAIAWTIAGLLIAGFGGLIIKVVMIDQATGETTTVTYLPPIVTTTIVTKTIRIEASMGGSPVTIVKRVTQTITTTIWSYTTGLEKYLNVTVTVTMLTNESFVGPTITEIIKSVETSTKTVGTTMTETVTTTEKTTMTPPSTKSP